MANITKPLGLSNIWASGGTKIDPGTSKVNIGWVVQLPPYEYQNWIDNRQDRAIAHISQHGIPEWDSATEYQGLLSYAQGSDGVIYKCLQTNTNKDPSNTLNNLFWVVAFEQYGSVAVVSSALSTHITNYQTLSGIGNLSAARTNLSVYSKSESDTRFAGLNGSPGQVFSVAVATQPEHAVRLGQVSGLLAQATESSLGVVKLATIGATETGTDDITAITPLKGNAVYLKKSGNLSGLTNYFTARTNLGLGSAAVQSASYFLQSSNNLSDLVDVVAARTSLGLTTTATRPESYFLRTTSNLSDIQSASAARSNLGLGSAATRNVGTDVGTVATGDDTRIVNAVQNTRLVVAGSGLTGGGNLTGDISLAMGVPTTLTGTTTNTVTTTSHSHAIDTSALFFDRSLTPNGYINLGGLLIQWGSIPPTTTNSVFVPVTFPKPFSSTPLMCGMMGSVGIVSTAGQRSDNGAVATSITKDGFSAYVAWDIGTDGHPMTWLAIGI